MLTGFVAAIAVLVLLFVMMSVKIVHQGYRYTLEHFGRFVRVAEPGINFVMPFVTRVGRNPAALAFGFDMGQLVAEGIALVDAGHWATEAPWLDEVAARLAHRFGTSVDIQVSRRVTDPWTVHAQSTQDGGT